ncbi:MAG: DUF3883 domain-containing protein [Alistipes sp.]|nr:DUF3883 domain-containing protein [Alistipes sp.]
MKDLCSLIQTYYKSWEKDILPLESYKWFALKHFKENYNKRYGSISEWIDVVFCKAGNLLTSHNYLPLGMLKDFSSKGGEPILLRDLFGNLLQHGLVPTNDRVLYFISGSKKIMQAMANKGYAAWKGRKNLNSYQDVHAISVYLSMFYPNDFYIYKYTVFKDFAKLVDYKIASKNAIDRLFEYQRLCDIVKNELIKNKDLIDSYRGWLKDYSLEDENLNLLTQDFIYAVAVHLNDNTYEKIKGNKPRVRNFDIIKPNEIISPSSTHKEYTYKGVKDIDYHRIYRQNKESGTLGELWVMNYEKDRLKQHKLDTNLASHIAKEKGDGYGYDIYSVEKDGVTPRFIEVKTTSKGISQPIYFTNNELTFSKENKEHYYIYRVYNFRGADKTADLTIIEHRSLDEIPAEPILYKAVISRNK